MHLYLLIPNHMKTNHLYPIRHAENSGSPAMKENCSPWQAVVAYLPSILRKRGRENSGKITHCKNWATPEVGDFTQ